MTGKLNLTTGEKTCMGVRNKADAKGNVDIHELRGSDIVIASSIAEEVCNCIAGNEAEWSEPLNWSIPEAGLVGGIGRESIPGALILGPQAGGNTYVIADGELHNGKLAMSVQELRGKKEDEKIERSGVNKFLEESLRPSIEKAIDELFASGNAMRSFVSGSELNIKGITWHGVNLEEEMPKGETPSFTLGDRIDSSQGEAISQRNNWEGDYGMKLAGMIRQIFMEKMRVIRVETLNKKSVEKELKGFALGALEISWDWCTDDSIIEERGEDTLLLDCIVNLDVDELTNDDYETFSDEHPGIDLDASDFTVTLRVERQQS